MFRLWDYLTNRFYYGFDFTLSNDGNISEIFLLDIPISESEPNASFRSFEDVVIESFTGLLDKDRQKIYVGDIIDYNDDGECIGYVVYNAPSYEIITETGFPCCLKGGPHQRVIGNIHENPELLEREEKPRPVIANGVKYDSYADYLKSRKGE